jgi:hypothetical protein
MHINPIHAGPVALAQRLAQWWHNLDTPDGPSPDATQLMLLSECVGRYSTTALAGVLVVGRFRKHLADAGKRLPDTGSSR